MPAIHRPSTANARSSTHGTLQEDWLRLKGYEGFRVRTRRVLLGKGPEIYAKAKKKMVNWELNDAVPWCNFLEGEHGVF